MNGIKGFIENTLLDYPGKIASVIFLGGCNFRCPFCQNPALVLRPQDEPDIPEEQILSYLAKPESKKWIDGVCISGGEPTIHADLPEFIRKLKKLGYLVKLDTNGTNPKKLEELYKEKLLDFVAMDIKSPLGKYSQTVCAPVSQESIQKSVDLIRASGVDYEFRATAVPGLFSKEDAIAIGKWLSGSKAFYLQQFRSVATVDPSFEGRGHFHAQTMGEFAQAMKPYFQKVETRGV